MDKTKPQAERKLPIAFSLDNETRDDLRMLAEIETDGNMSQMIRRLVRRAKALLQAQACEDVTA